MQQQVPLAPVARFQFRVGPLLAGGLWQSAVQRAPRAVQQSRRRIRYGQKYKKIRVIKFPARLLVDLHTSSHNTETPK